MALEKGYWSLVDPIWEVVKIYDGPEAFLATFGKVQRECGLLYAAHFCQSEVCNGGFDQFFFNSTGVLAPEALEGFAVIGQPQIQSLLSQAMSILGSPYVREREARQYALERLPADSFEELNQKFFALIETEAGGFEVAADIDASRVVSS